MKTILHLSPLAAIGGCEVNALRLVEGLSEYEHRVLVFDRRGPMSAQWQEAGAHVEHLEAWQGTASTFRSALSKWTFRHPTPDAIFFWSVSRLPVVLGVIRRWSTPVAVHLGNPAARGIRQRTRFWLAERLQPKCPLVKLVACSNYVAASYRNAPFFRRFPLQVIYNPVPPLFRQRHYRPLPLATTPRIGMVARLDPIKDHATLIRALVEISRERPDVVVEFAGDGSLREALEREAKRLGVGDRVRFLGFVPVGALLAEWDVYVHSTTEAEGMGTAVAEAMMAGLPCVVTDLPAMREVCGRDGANYVPRNDAASLSQALLKLINNRSVRENLGLLAQKRAQQLFASATVANAYLLAVLPGQGDPKLLVQSRCE